MRQTASLAALALLAAWVILACGVEPQRPVADELPTWAAAYDDGANGRRGMEGDTARGPSGARKALDFWGESRAYPAATIPEGRYREALRAQRRLEVRFARPVKGGIPPWTPIGPTNVGGRTLCLAFHPDDPRVLFAGSASGGLWKSVTGGVGADAWDYVATGFPVLGVATIAIDPTDGDVMYIGTGEAYSYEGTNGGEVIRTTRGSYGVGILKTVDGGATWLPVLDWTYAQSRGVWSIVIDPTDTGVVYAATTEGLYRSSDAGTTWDLIHDVIMAMTVVIHPTDPDLIFVANGNFGSAEHGIYRSEDGGQNWDPIGSGLPASWTGKPWLSISPAAPDTIFASLANSNAGRGLYRSADRGDTWLQVNATDYAQYQGWYSHYVLASPFDADTLFTGGIEIWRSTDGGATLERRSRWQSIFLGTSPPEGPIGGADYAHADHHFAIWHPGDPDTVYFTSDGGVFRTTDLGETFESLIGGYQTSQFYNGFSNSWTDAAFAMGGLQDNFTVIYEGTGAWRRVIGGDGTWTAQHPTDGSTIYASAQNLQAFRSEDAGQTWTAIRPPTQSGDVTAFVAPYVLSPDDPDVLYAGRARVYRSDDGGDTWAATNGSNPLSPGNPLLSLATAPGSVDVAYAGTAPLAGPARMFATKNGGVSWFDVTGTLPDRYPSDIVVDPLDEDRVLVTFLGFGTSHVFLSSDGGASWSDIGGGLPDIPTSAVEIDPDHPQILYVGTDLGTYLSLDAGETWQPFNDGMPLAMINDLKVFRPGRKIRAATHGNGAWERAMFEPTACDGPGEATSLTLSQAGGPGGTTTLTWSVPLDPGDAPVRYDTLSSSNPGAWDNVPAARCVESNGRDTVSLDTAEPGPDGLVFYLVRARSLCGTGPAGNDSAGVPRVVRVCPG